MAKTGVTENRNRRYIRIEDEGIWEMIDKVAKADKKYENSFNAIINDSLIYGLPVLIKSLSGEVDIPADVKDNMELILNDGEASERMLNGIVVRLLKEINLNVLMCKSMLSQLVNAIGDTAEGRRIIPEKYKQGAYSDTPEYLESYEMRELKKLRH